MIEIKALASGSKGNCYYVTDGVTPLLLECGLPWRQIQQGLGFKTSELAACLISHEHKDHCKAAHDVMRAGIDIYANKQTLTSLNITGENRHRWYQVNAHRYIFIGTFTLLTFELEHDVQNTGYLIYSNETKEKLVYLTDSFYSRYCFEGLNYIMIECNYAADILQANVEAGLVPLALKNRLLESHFSLEHVKEFLKANDLSKVREIWLLHLSDGNSDADRFKREIQMLTGKMVFVA